MTCGSPARSIITFEGLTSRWTTPCACASSSASATAATSRAASSGASGPSRNRSSSVSPSMNSVTRKATPSSVSPASYRETMCGCSSCGRAARLAQEALALGGILQRGRAHDLDRDGAGQLGVARAEHVSERADPELFEQLELAEPHGALRQRASDAAGRVDDELRRARALGERHGARRGQPRDGDVHVGRDAALRQPREAGDQLVLAAVQRRERAIARVAAGDVLGRPLEAPRGQVADDEGAQLALRRAGAGGRVLRSELRFHRAPLVET